MKKFFNKILSSKIVLKIRSFFSSIGQFFADHIPNRTRKAIWGIVFLLPLMIGFVYFFFIPFITSVIYSFSYVENMPGEGVVTSFVGLNNYKYAFTEAANIDGSFTQHLVNAIIVIATDIPVVLIFSLIIAVVLNTKFKGRALVRAIF